MLGNARTDIGSTNRAMEAKLTLLEMRGKRQIDLDT